MSSKTIQYGPFTPQELEAMVRELQAKNIPFEIAKDEAEEQKFRRIDYANLVKQADLRVEHYLAQVFYLTIAKSDVERVSVTLAKFGFPTEFSENPEELVEDSSNDFASAEAFSDQSASRRMSEREMSVSGSSASGFSESGLSSEDRFMKAKLEKKKFNRRLVARLLVLWILCGIVLAYAFR